MRFYQNYKYFAAFVVTRHWVWVVGLWLLVAIALKLIAPPWESVAKDGDFEFMPANLPSRVGQQLLDEAFPAQRARSKLVIILQREEHELMNADLAVCYDLGRRLLHLGYANQRAMQPADPSSLKPLLDGCIQMDAQWFDAIRALAPERTDLLRQRLAQAYLDRSLLLEESQQLEPAKLDREKGELLGLDTDLDQMNEAMFRSGDWHSVLDVWTWDDPVLGGKLGAGHTHARMLVLQLDSEFMAVGNVRLMEAVEELIASVRSLHQPLLTDGLSIGISGPPAVGADMLRAAKSSVQQAEWMSICMVLAILVVINRGPFLVTIPLVTIVLSLSVAMSTIALLAKPDEVPGVGLSLVRVFTTTRIFIVVLLFGIGTDFCLFLISRCREGLKDSSRNNRKTLQRLVSGSWMGVHDALLGSALTTSIGLLMMSFSNFEKFRSSGIVIGLAILITLLVCLTFTPAMICGLGTIAFWPSRIQSTRDKETSSLAWTHKLWAFVANSVIRYPRLVLILCLIALGIPAIQGFTHRSWVTYDFLKELSWAAPSRVGARLIDKYFSTRDNSPITVVIVSEKPLEEAAMRDAINQLRLKLYVHGVASIRSLTDPLGDYPPDRRMGLFSTDAWKRRILENHRITQTHYVAALDHFAQRAARMDILLGPDPFSVEAEDLLQRIHAVLHEETHRLESPWFQAKFACTGTTAGIADLKKVTQEDQQRIQVLVTIGVWCVLFILLRRPWFSAYLMFTVLLSYLTTLGLTQCFFAWAYGHDFRGLDWKVPLFLFVILVAVGQDYNVYIATRIFEEQAKRGPIQGLFHAMVTTGGIITSCGLVMAATFFSMTGGAVSAWLGEQGFPAWMGGNADTLVLRGIVELGFALGLGVLIDTLLVRTVLVPAMFVWLTRLGKSG